MSPDPGSSVRIVIQCVYPHDFSLPMYVLAFYPGPKNLPCHSEKFLSAEKLILRLKAAIPGFDETLVVHPPGTTEIIFAQTMKLSDAQREALAWVD